VLKALRGWEDFLRVRKVDSEEVTIHDLIAFEDSLVDRGYTHTRAHENSLVRSYYLKKGAKVPGSKWSKLAGEIEAHEMPRVIGTSKPHQPFDARLLPKILEASRHVTQRAVLAGSMKFSETYSEAFPVVATLLYTGARAQIYGLMDAQVQETLDNDLPFVKPFVKEGRQEPVIVHEKLKPIWRRHLDERDFEGPQFFRRGRNPYTYQDGSADWREDFRGATANDNNVARLLHGTASRPDSDSVERRLLDLYGVKEHLNAHRFRKSVGTWYSRYGFDAGERRAVLTHKAEGKSRQTEEYDIPLLADLQKKVSQIDLGSAEWVEAHWPTYNLFLPGSNGGGSGNGGGDPALSELVTEVRSMREEMALLRKENADLRTRLGGRAVA
jgi:hypothetical protein